MTRFVARHKVLILICLLALVIRVAFFLALRPWDEATLKQAILVQDAVGYDYLAHRIIDTGSYPSAETFRTPGYPMLVALMYFLFGGTPAAVLLLQILLDVGVVLLTYRLAREVFDSRTIGHVAAFLYAISLLPPYFSTRLLTEIPFTAVFILGILVFIRALKTLGVWRFALAGLILCVATLIRPAAQLFPVVMAAVTLCRVREGRTKHAVLCAVALLAVFAVTISSWQLRNHRLYGYYALSSIEGSNLCTWNVAMTEANARGTTREEALKELVGDSLDGITHPFEQGKVLNKIALEYIRTHPAEYAYCHMKGAANVFLGTAKGGVLRTFLPGWKGWEEDVPLAESTVARVTRLLRTAQSEYYLGPILATKQLIEYAFVVAACVVVFYSRERRLTVVFLVLGTLYFAGISGVIGHARYRVPAIPLYLTIAAKGMVEGFEFWKARRKKGGRGIRLPAENAPRAAS